MDTRVLTLFDDEVFFPKQEPKKKLKKETPAKETASNEAVQIFPEQEQPEPVITPEEIVTPDEVHTDTTPDIKPESSAEVLTPLVEASNSENEVIDEPKNEAPLAAIEAENQEYDNIEEGYDEEVVLNINDKETENGASKQAQIAAADDELNKQILSELIQVDYTSLIHRDYPFDLQTAAVVPKSKTAAEQEPVAEQERNEEEQEDEVFEDIVPLPEWKLDKKYYTIGEVAQLFSVNTSHIRVLGDSGFPFEQLQIFALDRDKKGIAEEEVTYKVIHVPTIIVSKDGKEKGRITEIVNKSIESDLAEIIKE